MLKSTLGLSSLLFLLYLPAARAQKPPLTLDEFFNAVDIRSVQISPSGHSVVIETQRPDWGANRFRNDLWIYRDGRRPSLVQLTNSGHDSSPEWSPNSQWVAFLSDREKGVVQVYVISADGGEDFPLSSGDEEVHAFDWSEDSRRIYFATRDPQIKPQMDAHAEEWKDVIRFREAERGDTLFSVDVTFLIGKSSRNQREGLPAPEKFATIPYRWQMATSPDGRFLGIATDSPSGRFETHEPYGIYLAELSSGTLHAAIHT